MKKLAKSFLDGIDYYRLSLCLILYFLLVSFNYETFGWHNVSYGSMLWAGIVGYILRKKLPVRIIKRRLNTGLVIISLYIFFLLYTFAYWPATTITWSIISILFLIPFGIIGGHKTNKRTSTNVVLKENEKVCEVCGSIQSSTFKFCPICGSNF